MESSVIKATLMATLTGFVNAILYVFAISDGELNFQSMFFLALIGAAVVFAVVLVWGLPMHYVLKRFKKTGMGWYISIGIIPSLMIPLDYLMGGYYTNLIIQTLFFSYVGIVAAIAFKANIRGMHA